MEQAVDSVPTPDCPYQLVVSNRKDNNTGEFCPLLAAGKWNPEWDPGEGTDPITHGKSNLCATPMKGYVFDTTTHTLSGIPPKSFQYSTNHSPPPGFSYGEREYDIFSVISVRHWTQQLLCPLLRSIVFWETCNAQGIHPDNRCATIPCKPFNPYLLLVMIWKSSQSAQPTLLPVWKQSPLIQMQSLAT
jgi:hypothetical protein